MWVFDILLIINLVAILYVWLDTDAIAEWGALLRLKFLKYDEYIKNKTSPVPMIASQTYAEFLACRYGKNSFFIRLVTCPICFSVWMNIALICVFYSRIGMSVIGFNIVLTWLLYYVLRHVLNRLNE